MKKILVGLILLIFTGFFTSCNSYESPLLVIFNNIEIRRIEKGIITSDDIWITPWLEHAWGSPPMLYLTRTVYIYFPQEITMLEEYSITVLSDYEIKEMLSYTETNFSSFFLRYCFTTDDATCSNSDFLGDITKVYRFEKRWDVNPHVYYFIIYDHKTLRILSSPPSRFIIQNDLNAFQMHAGWPRSEVVHETIFVRYFVYSGLDLSSIIFPNGECYFISDALSQGLVSIRELNNINFRVWQFSLLVILNRQHNFEIMAYIVLLGLLMVSVTALLQSVRFVIMKIKYKILKVMKL